MKKFIVALAFPLLLLNACSSSGGINSWVGQAESSLLAQYGYPMEKREVGENAYVYIYPSGTPTFNYYFTVVNGRVTNARTQYEGGL